MYEIDYNMTNKYASKYQSFSLKQLHSQPISSVKMRERVGGSGFQILTVLSEEQEANRPYFWNPIEQISLTDWL